MTRALSLTCLSLLALVALATLGSADAFAKPKIAILGLEVLNPAGGTLDPAITVAAKDLTDALRARARTGSGKYEIATNADKELVDEKLMNTCDTELPVCMAPIGSQIGASMLLYGRIRKEGTNFIVDLVLLNVTAAKKERSVTNQKISVADAADAVKLGVFARKQYQTLTDDNSFGTLIVEIKNPEYKPDIHRGSVMIDGEDKGNLSSGRLPIPNLPDGKHTLEIKSLGGFQRFSTTVMIVANERLEFPVTLTPNPGGIGIIDDQEGTLDHGPRTNYWRPTFVVGSIIAIAGASFWTYAWFKETSASGLIRADVKDTSSKGFHGPTGGDCARGTPTLVNTTDQQHSLDQFNETCKFRDWTIYGIAGASIGGAIVIGTFYMAWLRGNDTETRPKDSKNGGRTKKPSFAITPIISPNSGGATLQIDW